MSSEDARRHMVHAQLTELLDARRERRPIDPSRYPLIADMVRRHEEWWLANEAMLAAQRRE